MFDKVENILLTNSHMGITIQVREKEVCAANTSSFVNFSFNFLNIFFYFSI